LKRPHKLFLVGKAINATYNIITVVILDGELTRECPCYRKPGAKAPVIHPGDEAPFLVWGGEVSALLDRGGIELINLE
jgi:hypothetical protein